MPPLAAKSSQHRKALKNAIIEYLLKNGIQMESTPLDAVYFTFLVWDSRQIVGDGRNISLKNPASINGRSLDSTPHS